MPCPPLSLSVHVKDRRCTACALALDKAWKRKTALTEPPSPPTDPVLISSALAVLLLTHADGWLNVAPTKRSAAESYGTLIVTLPAALSPSLLAVIV